MKGRCLGVLSANPKDQSDISFQGATGHRHISIFPPEPIKPIDGSAIKGFGEERETERVWMCGSVT